MAFKTRSKGVVSAKDPEALFRDLRNRSVEGLLSHQADILRRYHESALDKPNVAIELPTGSGKTLVGLLIGEYRRRTFDERIIYLCPTRQLVKQVVEQSVSKYGIKTTAFIGPHKDYDPKCKADYLSGDTIAVTTYSALFNTNTFFHNANMIILDDAHASENYITSFWSVNINRKDYGSIYESLLEIIKDLIPSAQYNRFKSELPLSSDLEWVEKVATIRLMEQRDNIISFLDIATSSNELRYPWSIIRDNISACHLYISWNCILLRPVIPPSLTHRPFSNAKQRLFMSATLGAGGDLERITGIPEFCRIPIPGGWDEQGVGRRFFMFPELSLTESESFDLSLEMMNLTPRTLVLVPDDKSADYFKDKISDTTDHKIFNSSDIERSKKEFTETDNAVAVLANRFDGIDLLGEECRLLIVNGLPKSTNLQEKFFDTRMAAYILLKDRIRTRIVQAVGRCTRSATDFAGVCILGGELADMLILKENRQFFHPEIQGELIFGIEQSKSISKKEFLENLAVFLDHKEDWDEVDSDIVYHRNNSKQKTIHGSEKLLNAAKYEVLYQYEVWRESYEKAIELANKALTFLDGEEVKGYRGFWYYLAGCAAWSAFLNSGQSIYEELGKKLFRNAANCTSSVLWLRQLSNIDGEKEPLEIPELLVNSVENLETKLIKLGGTGGRKFEAEIEFIISSLNDSNSTKFEEGHRRLGELLGYYASNSSENGAPDPWWILDDKLCLVAEDKMYESEDKPICITHTRQAASHPKWIKHNTKLDSDAEIIPVIITNSRYIDKDAIPFAEDVYYWHIDDFRKWAQEATCVIRKLINKMSGSGNLLWRAAAIEELKQSSLDPENIVKKIKNKLLREIPVK